MEATKSREFGAAADAGTHIEDPPLDRRLLATVLVAAIAAWAAIEWLTPAPVHPEHGMDALSTVVNSGFFILAFTGAFMLVERRAVLGYGCLAGAAWIQLAGVVACPATGHHDYGAWWAGQMAVCLAFAVVSTAAAAISARAMMTERRSLR
jgi:hypothetical protein